MRWVLLAFLIAAPLAASAEEDEAKLQKKLDTLEKENEKLRDQLKEKQADRQKLFNDVTKAEQAAGLQFRTTTAVAGATTPATTPPVSTPAGRHAYLRLQKAEITLDVTFGPPRNVKAWRVYGGTCDVKKKGR